jgi:hypothetical protein
MISQVVPSIYHRDRPIRDLEKEAERIGGITRRANDEERNEKENATRRNVVGRRRGGRPFVGHISGPPWRLIACNALPACQASELPPEENPAKNSGRAATKPRRSRGRGAMSGTLGPTRRGGHGRRRPLGRRSPRAIASGDGVASFPLPVPVAAPWNVIVHWTASWSLKMKTCSSVCWTTWTKPFLQRSLSAGPF